MLEIHQRLSLYYCLVYICELLALQLLFGSILQFVHKVKQQVIVGKVENLKHKGGELLDIVTYTSCLLQLPMFACCLIQDTVWGKL